MQTIDELKERIVDAITICEAYLESGIELDNDTRELLREIVDTLQGGKKDLY